MNNKTFRIKTGNQLGKLNDRNLVVNLDQHYNQLDVLSLTLTQSDIYTNKCSDWGVVVGRVTANNGVGVPNAKVSIFIPLQPEDESRPEIVNKYPFKQISDRKDGVRYNLLPSVKQSREHTPIGTFPTKEEILGDNVWIEVYQKYYKYTTRTNNAGDYMFYGVPIGTYTLHYDLDLSDIGNLSVLPFELIAQGEPKERFASPYKYKASKDIDRLPQVITKDKTIQVQPFWGSEDLCEVSLLRSDFDLTEVGVELKSYCLFMGSVVSDTGGNSVNKNCKPRKKMGEHEQLVSGPGFIDMLNIVDSDGDNIPDKVEQKDDPTAVIDENGVFAYLVELTGQKVITDELGNEVLSPDGSSGIAKNGFYRFKFGLGIRSDARIRETANYIVPNNGTNDHAYLFNRNDFTYYDTTSGLPIDTVPGFNTLSENGGTEIGWSVDSDNNFDGGPLFKTLERKKIYTVRNYIPKYQKDSGNSTPRNENFLGFKQTASDGGKTPIPYNRVNPSVNFFTQISCALNSTIFFLVATINKTVLFALNFILNAIGSVINGILGVFCGLINGINNALCPLSFTINLGQLLGSFDINIGNVICLTTPPACSNGGVNWAIAYISYNCCKSCPPTDNCNCYIPWFTNCYSGDYCDDTNPDLKRCKSNQTAKCKQICEQQRDRHQAEYQTTTDLEADELQRRDCAFNVNCDGYNSTGSYDSSPNNDNSYNFCVDSLKQCKLIQTVCEADEPLKYEFYNSWLTGVLYFYLFKYKERRNSDGDIKSIKFCDVDSYDNKFYTYPFLNETEDTVIGDRESWLNPGENFQFDIDSGLQSGSGLIKYYPRQTVPALSDNAATYTKGPYDNIYYAARSLGRPLGWNTTEYGNPHLLFATDIMNLGSYLTELDPDGYPFFIDLVPPTTFKEPAALTDFYCLSCNSTIPRAGGEQRFEKICEWGTILNDEQETSTLGEYEVEVDDTYHTGRYFILTANTAYNIDDTTRQLMYGSNGSGAPFVNGQSIRNYVPYGVSETDFNSTLVNLDPAEIYVNSVSYYDPAFYNATSQDGTTNATADKYIRYQANPYYFYFGLLPGRTAIDKVKTNFITTTNCDG